MPCASCPDTISDVDALDALLSDPSDQAVAALSQLPGDIIVLGVAGKMGPTLARMARRAADLAGSERRVIGVARFSDPTLEAWLQSHRIETIRCDLLDERTRVAPAGRAARRLHGRTEVRIHRSGIADVGHECGAAGRGRAPLCGQPDRRVLDRKCLRPDTGGCVADRARPIRFVPLASTR